VVITHNPIAMIPMNRLFRRHMADQGVSQLAVRRPAGRLWPTCLRHVWTAVASAVMVSGGFLM
jgi:hypothetical protein